MNKTLSIFSILFVAVAFSGLATAQPSNPPHEVYGTVSDSDTGDQFSGLNVEARVSGSAVASDTTDSSGFYDVDVPDDYSGQSFKIFVEDSEEQSYSFTSGASDNLDVSGDFPLSVTLSDTSVNTGNTVDLSPTVTYGGDASYSWSITDDPTEDASLSSNSGEKVTFEAPDNKAEIKVEVEATRSSSTTDSDTATVEVTTESSSSSVGSGSQDSGTQKKSVTAEASTENPSESKVTVDQVNSGQEVEVNVQETEEKDSNVEQVSFTSNSDASNVEVSIQDLGTDQPSDSTSAAEEGEEVLNYQSIEVNGLEDDQIDSAKTTFKVSKQKLQDSNRGPEDVTMKRNSNGNWQTLTTSKIGETDTAHRFEAMSSGYSYYAVVLNKVQRQDDQDQDQDQEPTTGENQTDNRTDQQPDQTDQNVPWVPLAAIFGLLVLAAVVYAFSDPIADKLNS